MEYLLDITKKHQMIPFSLYYNTNRAILYWSLITVKLQDVCIWIIIFEGGCGQQQQITEKVINVEQYI